MIHWVELDPGRTLCQLSPVDHTSPQATQIMTPDILTKALSTIILSFLLHYRSKKSFFFFLFFFKKKKTCEHVLIF